MKRLLVAHDLSARADLALRRAASLARTRSARLTVLHVVKEDLPGDIRQGLRAEAERWLDGQVRSVAEGCDARVAVDEGQNVEVIAGWADRENADLILIGAQRPSLLREFFTGTTVERLARKGRWPVLVVKAEPEADYASVLVAVDLSEGSRAAVVAAARMFPDAALHAVRILDMPGAALGAVVAPNVDDDAAEKETADFLAEAVGAERIASITVRIGAPAPAIAETARTIGVDLAVLGSTGRSGVGRYLLGSVAADSLRLLPVDAIVVPAGAAAAGGG